MLAPPPKSTYLAHPSDWAWCGARLLASDEVCGLDTETIGCDPDKDTAVYTARVILFSVAIPDGPLHPRGFRQADGFVLPPQALDDPYIREWLESPKPKVAHNGRYDRHALANGGVLVDGLVDTLDIFRVIAPGRERYGLKSLVPDFLDCETYGEFKEVFSEPIVVKKTKVNKYKVCVVHGRAESRRRKYCEVCFHKELMVDMEETVVEEKTLARRRMIPLQEVCAVRVNETPASRLVPNPGEHQLWETMVDYAGFDAIAAAQLYQYRKERLEGWRPAKVPVL